MLLLKTVQMFTTKSLKLSSNTYSINYKQIFYYGIIALSVI